MKLIICDKIITCKNGVAKLETEEKGILVSKGFIEKIDNLDAYKTILKNNDIEKIDTRGFSLMPGLIDGHLHLCFSASEQPLNEINEDDEFTMLLRMVNAAHLELKSGVTTVRDCGAKGLSILKLRDSINNGLLQGPNIISAGAPLTVTGGHCHFLDMECDSKEEVIKAVRWLCKNNVDYIKVMVSGGNMTRGSDSLINQYNKDILMAIVEEAHMRDKKVAGHVHSTQSIENAIMAGFDTLEHCSFKSQGGEDYREDLVMQMIEKNIAVNPAMGKAYILPAELAAPLPDKVAIWKQFQNSRFSTTERMYKSGVKIIMGTDAGCKNTKFNEYILTMKMMHEKVHMSNEDIILSATSLQAKCLGIDNLVGSIEVGKQADLIYFTGNPLESLDCFQNIKGVIKKGEVVTL